MIVSGNEYVDLSKALIYALALKTYKVQYLLIYPTIKCLKIKNVVRHLDQVLKTQGIHKN